MGERLPFRHLGSPGLSVQLGSLGKSGILSAIAPRAVLPALKTVRRVRAILGDHCVLCG